MRVRRRKHTALHRGPTATPTGPTERSSMDFVHDALADGRPFRVLTVANQWSRQSPLLMVDTSMSGQRVGRALEWVLLGGAGAVIRQGGSRDRVPVARTRRFGESSGAQLDFTRPGRPTENAFIESFDGRLRDECLNVIQFTSIEDARAKIEAWRIDYNRPRPHSSLWHRTPDEFVRQHHTTGTTDKVACSG